MIKKLLRSLGRILYLLRIYQLFSAISKVFNYVYSGSLQSSLLKCGKDFYVRYPAIVFGENYISIGNNFTAFERLRIEAHDLHNDHRFYPEIQIGNDVSLNLDCHIACINKITIGNGVLIGSKVFITDHFHGSNNVTELNKMPNERILFSKGTVIIEDDVWIGEGVAIMPNVTIGKNCVVGANSVVTKSFPPNSIIGGVPARLIKTI